ncbi:MAG: glycerol-3-phosphate 1-O-acyltransferase PlsY [Paracoccaceae bacterium]
MPIWTSDPLTLIVWAALGYLLGSVPFGIVLSRLFGLPDPRTVGSGNIGATNVLRSGHRGAAAGTLILDALKGGLAVLAARLAAGEDAAQVAGLMAFIGHCFPVWLGFRGGKGVATYLGTLTFWAWPVGLGAIVTWLAVAALFRISSAAAIVAAVTGPLWALYMGVPEGVMLTIAMGLVVLWRHRENIARIVAGREPRIGR